MKKMKFVQALKKKREDNNGVRNPVIAFLGDSVTQGCFEVWQKDGRVLDTYDTLKGYPEGVKRILALLYPKVPITIFNAGVSGSSAKGGLERLRRDVLGINPDLLIVCFGLNDCGGDVQGIHDYKQNLKQIFVEANRAGIETIFMTPNMLCTNTDNVNGEEFLIGLADMFKERQLQGVFDRYIEAAREVCQEEGIRICDCYAIWKQMYESGVDTNGLLANGINHPIREMHELFAWELVKTIITE